MTAQQHGSNLYRIPRFGGSLFNSYLVRDGGGLTAIDTNMPGSAPGIVRAAQEIGWPITRIVLTHAHGDHVGSLDALHALVPEAEVLISERESRLLRGERTLDAAEQLPGARLRGGYQTCKTLPTRLLNDGDMVGALRVVSTPGHTPGHLSLFDPRDGTLIAGDALQTAGGLAASGQMRPLFPLPALATWHAPTALESARRLAELHPARLAAAHGSVLEEPERALRAVLARAS
ncbi:MBL fold metallo-hydrolase [Deinococcus sp.]|uniref:MBL fold metallo-hydrolase n=1 Tax=Deinococcus sp. TaxID=47478 RepID=UPI003CC69B07